jgi:hypothetical protein
MRDMCLHLDRLDGILIEMVVEAREPSIACCSGCNRFRSGYNFGTLAAFYVYGST